MSTMFSFNLKSNCRMIFPAGSESYRVFRNAISDCLSRGVSRSPNSWPLTARVVDP